MQKREKISEKNLGTNHLLCSYQSTGKTLPNQEKSAHRLGLSRNAGRDTPA
jgi:hypothetical protein